LLLLRPNLPGMKKYSFALHSGKNGHESLSDDELATALRGGSEAALSAVINRYAGIVYKKAQQVLSDSGEAEEVVQQVFLEVFSQIKTFYPAKGALKAWILRRASSRAVDRLRQLQAQRINEWDSASDEIPISQESAEFLGMTRPEISRLVEELVEILPPTQRTVVQMRYFRGMSLKEIQEEMNEPMFAVLHLLYDAIKQMRTVAFLRQIK